MINVLHLYYDLLNLYGENANLRSIVHNLELNNIKVKVKRNKKDTYDFWKVTYHNIDFTILTG